MQATEDDVKADHRQEQDQRHEPVVQDPRSPSPLERVDGVRPDELLALGRMEVGLEKRDDDQDRRADDEEIERRHHRRHVPAGLVLEPVEEENGQPQGRADRERRRGRAVAEAFFQKTPQTKTAVIGGAM